MLPRISIAHVIASLHPDTGGPPRTVVRLVDELSLLSGLTVRLFSQTLQGEPFVTQVKHDLDCHIAETDYKIILMLGIPLYRLLRREISISKPNILHSHGLWHPVNHWAARIASKYNIPFIIQPRGMLEPWALLYKGWKKRIVMLGYQRRDLEAASLYFATSVQEAENIRKLGLRKPVAVIPNGVDIPAIDKLETLTNLRTGLNRTALFLSRIHPKKGVLNLLEAWNQVNPEGWRLIIAGPDESNHLEEIMNRANEIGISSKIEYIGIVEGEDKEKLYNASDLFILPSFSENFATVVAEALAHGIPVITTYGTPWQELELRKCGWWIEPTVDGITQALKDAVMLDQSIYHQMCINAYKYAMSFNWSDIALQTTNVYRWVLGDGPKPDCVIVN